MLTRATVLAFLALSLAAVPLGCSSSATPSSTNLLDDSGALHADPDGGFRFDGGVDADETACPRVWTVIASETPHKFGPDGATLGAGYDLSQGPLVGDFDVELDVAALDAVTAPETATFDMRVDVGTADPSRAVAELGMTGLRAIAAGDVGDPSEQHDAGRAAGAHLSIQRIGATVTTTVTDSFGGRVTASTSSFPLLPAYVRLVTGAGVATVRLVQFHVVGGGSAVHDDTFTCNSFST